MKINIAAVLAAICITVSCTQNNIIVGGQVFCNGHYLDLATDAQYITVLYISLRISNNSGTYSTYVTNTTKNGFTFPSIELNNDMDLNAVKVFAGTIAKWKTNGVYVQSNGFDVFEKVSGNKSGSLTRDTLSGGPYNPPNSFTIYVTNTSYGLGILSSVSSPQIEQQIITE